MTFDRAWVLLFLLAPLGFAIWQWRRVSAKLAVTLKALAFASIVVALAEPRLEVAENKVATVVLVDTSAGVSDADLKRATEVAGRINTSRGRHWVRVIPFARSTRALGEDETGKTGALKHTSGDAGRATDMENAVRDAIAAAPGGMVPRIVLVSDGNENQGSVARAAWLAQQLRIPIDTVPLKGPPEPLLRVETIGMPGVVFSGEKFPIDLTISSPKKSDAHVELFAEGKSLGSKPVSLQAGSNQVRVHTNINVAGAVEIRGVVRGSGLGDAPFGHAVTLRNPRVLFLSNDPPGTEKNLLDALLAAQFQIDRSSDATAEKLSDYQLVVFNNWDLNSLPAPRKEEIEKYVKQGGGLLVIGGERNMYDEKKKVDDPVDRALPAKLAPPRSPEGTCVVLILDKSSSMEGRKMDLARVAAIGVIENLRPIDYIGVLIFDNSFHWAVPIRKAEDRNTIKRIVAGVTPDGGTQIAPALGEAYRRIQGSTATYRHIVLLTDGISEEGDSMTVAKDASGRRITISTVGLGQDVNRAYLEKVATFARGRSYFLTDPSGLEQILLKDVMEHTGSTAVEKPFTPVVAKQSGVLDGVGIESAPPLRGYVKFISKPDAETILTVDKKDPLLAVWQLGLGRSAVFTSDAKSRWAEKWVGWPGFDKFWINVFRNLLPQAQVGEARSMYDSATGHLVVEYKLAGHVESPAKTPEIFVVGPGEFRRPVPVKKVAEGIYRGEVQVGTLRGLFRVRPLDESPLFPETGLYRAEEEMTQFGSNEPLLRKVAEFTGGRFDPAPSDVFHAGGRSVAGSMRLWPGLLALAILLNLAELTIRKWDGIRETLFGRK